MKKKVLILAKAEPTVSKKYNSSVCTAGITDEGEFIRLYPIPYRIFCGSETKFSKYDWIEVECEPSDSDNRKESYKVRPESIKVVGHVNTDFNWMERNELLLPHISRNIKELEDKGASLGLIKPAKILDFDIDTRDDTSNIRKEYGKALQMIFEVETGSMRAIPLIQKMDRHYSYTFICEGENKEHKYICEDWELYQASRSWSEIYDTEEEVWEKIREKFYDTFTMKKDLCFFVGTTYRFGTWVIIGLYYPPKTRGKQTRLFSL